MIRRLFLMLLLSSLAACQTMQGGGTAGANMYDRAYLRANLKVGQTTPAEVEKMFGAPHYRQDEAEGPGMYSYDESRSNQSGLVSQALSAVGLGGNANMAATNAVDAQNRGRSLSIHFNKGRLSSYSVSESQR